MVTKKKKENGRAMWCAGNHLALFCLFEGDCFCLNGIFSEQEIKWFDNESYALSLFNEHSIVFVRLTMTRLSCLLKLFIILFIKIATVTAILF